MTMISLNIPLAEVQALKVYFDKFSLELCPINTMVAIYDHAGWNVGVELTAEGTGLEGSDNHLLDRCICDTSASLSAASLYMPNLNLLTLDDRYTQLRGPPGQSDSHIAHG